jgi:DNA segregation ATPase FtsK/SpoIIIE, S-DNA-T family
MRDMGALTVAMSSAAGRRPYGRSFISDDFQTALRRRLRELSGLALLGCVGVAVFALATWSVNDPSLSYATSAPVRNMLGVTGAIAADLAMQLFGLATIAIILPPAFWGWRFFTHRVLDRLRWRVLAWILGLAMSTAFASSLSRPPEWPLPTGIGGVTGDALLGVIAAIAGGPIRGAGQTLAESIFGMLALLTMGAACGFGFHRPDDEDLDDEDKAASISLGFLVHAMLSLRAQALVAIRALIEINQRRAPPAWPRTEPPLGGAAAGTVEPQEPVQETRDDEAEEPAKAAQSRKSGRKDKSPARKSADGYELPALALLTAPRPSERNAPAMESIRENATALEHVLGDFGVRGEIINARPGPVVTLYELEPAPGIKSSRVISLADDIARSMSALSARVAVVSGRNVIGIELPNPSREKVYLRELLADRDYQGSGAKLPLCLGKTIGGEAVIVDLSRMPHLLIAGTTGSGKSVAINTMVLSLLYQLRPEQCRLIMVDPKMLELSVYDGIPHLLTPVVTDPKKAVVALKWAVREMEDRYKKMAKVGVRNIDGYNARLQEAKSRGEALSRMVHTGYDADTGEAIYEKEEFDSEPLPYLVVIVDEMADLMMVAGKDIEGAIQRLAQMARAAGIHVVLATQRPSVDVITGTIKANFPTRISFQVTSKIDSRTILGEQGAEQLLGQGDMLYMAGGGRISRIHGPFVSDDEVEKIVRHLKSQGQPQYLDAVTAEDYPEGEGGALFDMTGMGGAEGGDLYQQAVQIVTRDRKATTSYLQRRLQIGYNRAASLIERMEKEGIVGQPNHAGKREILVGGDDDEDY